MATTQWPEQAKEKCFVHILHPIKSAFLFIDFILNDCSLLILCIRFGWSTALYYCVTHFNDNYDKIVCSDYFDVHSVLMCSCVLSFGSFNSKLPDGCWLQQIRIRIYVSIFNFHLIVLLYFLNISTKVCSISQKTLDLSLTMIV